MPSRYVTDVSRTQRDTGGTECGQDADKKRTSGGVTRDNHGTGGIAPGSPPETAPDRPPDSGGDAERLAQRERRAEAEHEIWKLQRQIEGLGAMRIMGRHSRERLNPSDLAFFIDLHKVPADKGQSAYEAGLRDQSQGVRCMCVYCGGMRSTDAEERRSTYRTKRYRELQGQGLDYAAIARQIELEISRGEHIEH